MFDKSWSAVVDGAVRAAIAEVDKLDSSEFLKPSLPSSLDRIAGKFTLQVARLRPDEKRGKRREFEREISDYGLERTVKASEVDVSIPFDGEAQSFEIAPSSTTLVYGSKVQVLSSELILTVSDDDQIERRVDEFVKPVTENLDRLRVEVERDLPRIRDAIDNRARQRKEEIERQKERDSKRSFPID